MKFALANMLLIISFLIAGGLPLLKGSSDSTIVFHSPVFLFLLLTLSVLLIYSCWRWKAKTFKYITFLLVHLGCVIILFGAVLGFFYEKENMMFVYVKDNIPKDVFVPLPAQYFEEDESKIHDLGFKMFCNSFEVEHYKNSKTKVSPFIKQFSTILKVDNFQKILK